MYISTRFRIVIHLCAFLVVLYSLTMIPPMVLALIEKDRSLFGFFYTFIITFSLGGIGWAVTGRTNIQLETRDGFIIIVLFWLLFSLISAMPLWLDDSYNVSLADAIFEGVSGITTTGASVFNDVSGLPKSILYYRAQLNFVGGLGVIVLAVAVLPLLGIGGMKLYQSEMPGPFKEERLTPRLADTAKSLWLTYLLLGAACTLAFWLAGMPFFDSICHGLSTVSLGGFSTRTESIGFYDSYAIELVAGGFSLLSAINFTLYFVALSRRSFKPFIKSAELRFFLLVASIVILIITLEVWRAGMYSLPASFVHAFFLTSSMITDNGLATADYASWPVHTIVLLLSASFFGGCVGSTCGGIKALRFLVLFKQSRHEVHQLAHPRAIMSIRVGNSPVNDRVLRSVWSFFFLYVVCTCFFIWMLNLQGYDLLTSFATVAACINNMGLGFGETAAGFGTLSDSAKYLMCAAMLLGRLEIYPVLILLSRTFWRS
ncbi:TrkH family potassium uptake protein [Buttiauxella sp. WJP83]|uniref:TrkH family potassium uptake protein n=1 Tax=Buttiauxella sp. WJP83 TaxID=2986951 RepID=UPI0022DDE31E|nr:TrkH family potassium uptake protein [Buttiauxella sp. WJP83]WBM69691.1 TrkH family potassium uptake protein [Buttiauxella sp. WJP83]